MTAPPDPLEDEAQRLRDLDDAAGREQSNGWEGLGPNDEPDWGEPIPLARRSSLTPFPVDTLAGWISAFVTAEATATQTPPDMAAMFCLAALATVAGGRVQVEPMPGWVEGVNIFVVVVMAPGERKSAVHREVTSPIVIYEQLLLDQARPDLAEQATIRRIAEVALGKAEKAAAGERDPLKRLALEEEAKVAASALDRLNAPAPPRLFTDDATPEALASLLYDNGGRIAILSAEGGIFATAAGRYSRSIPNLDVFLKGHAGDPIRVDRRGRPSEFVNRPALTVGLAVQPFILAQVGRIADFVGRGLLDRFLFSLPTGAVGYRATITEPVPEAIRQRYDTSLRALAASFDRFSEIITLKLSPEALTRFNAFRSEIEPRRRPDADLGHIQGWSSKLDGAVIRLAGLLHLASTFDTGWDRPIDETTIAGAITIGRYLIEHALAAFDEMGSDPSLELARGIVRWLRKGRVTTFTKRECHIANRGRFHRANELDPILELLEDYAYIRRDRGSASDPRTGRPPSPRFIVNPHLER